jgi:Tol biopolymer transport system component
MATNLVASDGNGSQDIFVHDRMTGATTRVSVSSAGAEGDHTSSQAAISADGRTVAFTSSASNLTSTAILATNVFVHDRMTGATSLVSLSTGNQPANENCYDPAISGDGRVVVFGTAATLTAGAGIGGQVYARDRMTSTTTLVSSGPNGAQGAGRSSQSAITADGRYVVFLSDAPDLVAGDSNGIADIFVRDRMTASTSRVSLTGAGAEVMGPGHFAHPSISSDGRFIAFDGASAMVVTGDTNGAEDIFLRDRTVGKTTRINIGPTGAQSTDSRPSAGAAISADGRFIAFESNATNLIAADGNGTIDIFVSDVACLP